MLAIMKIHCSGVSCEKSGGGKGLGKCLEACSSQHPGKGVSVGGCTLFGNTYSCSECIQK